MKLVFGRCYQQSGNSQTGTALPNHIVCFWSVTVSPRTTTQSEVETTPEHGPPHMPKSIPIARATPTLPSSAKREVPSRPWLLRLCGPPPSNFTWSVDPPVLGMSAPCVDDRVEGHAVPCRCSASSRSVPVESTHQRRVDRQLHAPEDWKAFGHHFQPSAIKHLPWCWQVQIADHDGG